MVKNSNQQKAAGNCNQTRKALFVVGTVAATLVLTQFMGVEVFANGGTRGTGGTGGSAADPVQIITNLGTLIFSFVRIIGIILTGLGIMQVGISLKGHDPSQRASGFLCVAGGIIIALAKEILATIGFTI